MSVISLKINWYEAHEYLTIDFDHLPEIGQLCESWEFWPASKTWGTYFARFVSSEEKGQTWTIIFDYLESDNNELVNSEPRFGRSTVTINLANRRVSADWKDAADTEIETSPFTGSAKPCKILDDSEVLFTLRDRETFTRIARSAANELRNRLIARDEGKCALSREMTLQVLEVAHIVEAHDSGSDVLANCMLLRADLHRLFDKRLLRFNKVGQVKLDSRCGESYAKELANKGLDEDVFKRVERALEERGERDVRITSSNTKAPKTA